jgi:hypothetical protein
MSSLHDFAAYISDEHPSRITSPTERIIAAGPSPVAQPPFIVEQLRPVDPDGSLHVTQAGSCRCKECWRNHSNEDEFCSSACRETNAIRRAGE